MRPSFPVVDPYECTGRRNTFVLGELDETYQKLLAKDAAYDWGRFCPGKQIRILIRAETQVVKKQQIATHRVKLTAIWRERL